MIKVDLITGFLGSGKTTFIKMYAKYLVNKGYKVGILENDYGAVNVDMMLLGELQELGVDLEMVAGACDYDCHKRRFKTKLIAMGMSGYDRVLIEPSGIFDVDEFFDSLYEEPLDRWYEIGSVIAIVDAALEERLSEQSEYLLASQLSNAGEVVLSKAQNASPDDIKKTVSHLNRVMEKFKCGRRFSEADVISRPWNEFNDADFEAVKSCSYVSENHVKFPVNDDNSFKSLYFMNLSVPSSELKSRIKQIMCDPSCGKVFRVKGFIPENGGWVELNATKASLEIKPISNGQSVIIVIGEELVKEKIEAFLLQA